MGLAGGKDAQCLLSVQAVCMGWHVTGCGVGIVCPHCPGALETMWHYPPLLLKHSHCD